MQTAFTAAELATIVKHYLIACVWADCPDGTYPRASNQAKQSAREDVEKFVTQHPAITREALNRFDAGYGQHPDAGSSAAAFGHDLYLTRQGHGVGFYDRDELGEILGKQLDAAASKFGACTPQFYRGWLYIH